MLQYYTQFILFAFRTQEAKKLQEKKLGIQKSKRGEGGLVSTFKFFMYINNKEYVMIDWFYLASIWELNTNLLLSACWYYYLGQ